LCSGLYQLGCDFIIDVQLQTEKQQREKILIDALSKRNYDLFQGTSRQLIREIEDSQYYLDESDFLLLHQLNHDLYHHLERDKYHINQIELEQTWANLDAFYGLSQAKIMALKTGNKNILNKKESGANSHSLSLKSLFQSANTLHKSKETNAYFELKKEVFDHWEQLKKRHQTDLLLHLLNFTYTNEVIQKDFGHEESFDLLKRGVEHQLFVINGKMRPVEFFNVGVLGFAYGGDSWTENFLATHRQYLDDSQLDFLIPLIYAHKANFEEDYEQVIELLHNVNPTNQLLYFPKIKTLLIRAYFEGVLKGEDTYATRLHYEMDSLRKMMEGSSKLPSTKTIAYLNFVKLLKKLIILIKKEDKFAVHLAGFEQLYKETSPIKFGGWLYKKFNKMKSVAPK
ncbi:MAG: hypothetical protein AAF960_07415, partial [Bacteroidota bacterium]